MDGRLVGWARAVKARRRNAAGGLPALWLFTDRARLPDALAAAGHLPPGCGGVVLRDDSDPGRRELARALARLCRERRLRLSVAGDWRLAASVRAGVHLRAGRRLAGLPRDAALTSSAHDVADMVRARRAGVTLVFLSPVFPTASHPGAPALGPLRWDLLQGVPVSPVRLAGSRGVTCAAFPCHAGRRALSRRSARRARPARMPGGARFGCRGIFATLSQERHHPPRSILSGGWRMPKVRASERKVLMGV